MSGTQTSEAEEFAKRGEEIYERDILPRLGPDDQGKAVAIEVETGDYEIDRNEVVAAHRLRERHPTAVFWFRRVGSRYFYRFGHHRSSAA
jgi:hypothetical protein